MFRFIPEPAEENGRTRVSCNRCRQAGVSVKCPIGQQAFERFRRMRWREDGDNLRRWICPRCNGSSHPIENSLAAKKELPIKM